MTSLSLDTVPPPHRLASAARGLVAALLLLITWPPGMAWVVPAPVDRGAVVGALDGLAQVYQGADPVAAAEGLRVRSDAIVETAPGNATLLRLDLSDGSNAALGPDTRLMLWPSAFSTNRSAAPLAYLLAGWLKWQPGAQGARTIVTPAFELQDVSGPVVMHVGPEGWGIFLEQGIATLVERTSGRSRLCQGPSYIRASTDPGTPRHEAAAPDAAALSAMPAAYRDPLPVSAHSTGTPHPQALPPATVQALRPWLEAEPVVRAAIARRFAARVHDRSFRHDLIAAHLDHSIEWHDLVHPAPAQASKDLPAGIPGRASEWKVLTVPPGVGDAP